MRNDSIAAIQKSEIRPSAKSIAFNLAENFLQVDFEFDSPLEFVPV